MTERRTPPVFLERRSYRQRRVRDMARILPVLGLILWLIPLMWQEGSDDAVGNASAMQYIFGVWVLLILLAFVISRRIRSEPGEQS